MVRSLLSLVLALTVLFGALPQAGYPRLLKSVRPLQSVNTVTGMLSTICTVTAIGDGYHWLGASHCTADPVFIEQEPVTILFNDVPLDIAVFRTEKAHAKPLKVQRTEPRVGQRVFMLGYALGMEGDFFLGTISNTAAGMEGQSSMRFAMLACGGDSGSVVVNSRDEIVSVLQFGWGKPCSGFSGGATWHNVARIVAQYGRA